MTGPASEFRQRLLPIVLSQSVGVGCGLFGVRLITHLVPPATLGSFGVFLAFTTLGVWVVHSGLVKYVGRHWGAAPDRAVLLHLMLAAWMRKLGWLALASAAATLVIARLAPNVAWIVFPTLFAAAGLLSITALVQAALQATRRHWLDFAVSSSGSLTRTLLPPAAFLAAGGATAGLYLGFCLHALSTALVAAWSLRPYWRRPAGSGVEPAAEISRVYEGPLFTVLASAGWMLAGLNRWAAAWSFGDTVAGYFTLASNIALIVPSVLGAVFLQIYQPGFYALADSGGSNMRPRLARRIDAAALVFGLAGLSSLAVLRLVAPLLVGPLIHEKYLPAIEWILPAGCFGIAAATCGFYHTMLIAGRRERACGPVDLSLAAVLTLGSLAAAHAGTAWFWWWLVLTPVLPPILSRPIARYYLFRPVAGEERAPDL